MTFEQFAAAHGLILKHVDFGKWSRTATTDKPKSKNGAYKYLGDVAFVQNHATMPEPAVWFPDKDSEIKVDAAEIARLRANADRQIKESRKQAAAKAQSILKQSTYEQHAYLDGKGFPEMRGLVYRPEEAINLLVVPMRVGKQVVGCQLINRDGEKKFLFGQRCSGAEFVIGNGSGDHWICEGYATALSLTLCLGALKMRHTIHVAFSAHNLTAIGGRLQKSFICCDNDVSKTGILSGEKTGHPCYLPEKEGDDLNDEWKREGTFITSQKLRKFVFSVK